MTKTFFLTAKTQGRIHTVRFIVDKSDAYIVRMHAWALLRNSTNYGYDIRRNIGNGDKISLAHDIVKPPVGYEVRHVNCDSMDFRKVNLIAVKREKGVCWRGHAYDGKDCKLCIAIYNAHTDERKHATASP